MGWGWLGGLFLFVFSISTSVGAETCSRALFRQTEIALARAINQPGLVLQHPTRVAAEQAEAEDRRVRWRIARWGVEYDWIAFRERARSTILEHYVAEGRIEGPHGAGLGNLYRVGALPAKTSAPSGLAWEHHGFAQLRRRLEEMGVEVLLDSSISLTGAGAYYFLDPTAPYIGLRIDSPFSDLLHEAAHAEFYHYGIPNLIRQIRSRVKRGEDVSADLGRERHRGFGQARLRALVRLLAQGYPITAIDEWFATRAEIDAHNAHGDPGERRASLAADRYARAHLLASLAGVALRRHLTPSESLRFAEALAYYGLTDVYQPHDPQVLALFQRYQNTLEDWRADLFSEDGRLANWKRAGLTHFALLRAKRERRKLTLAGLSTLEELQHPKAGFSRSD